MKRLMFLTGCMVIGVAIAIWLAGSIGCGKEEKECSFGTYKVNWTVASTTCPPELSDPFTTTVTVTKSGDTFAVTEDNEPITGGVVDKANCKITTSENESYTIPAEYEDTDDQGTPIYCAGSLTASGNEQLTITESNLTGTITISFTGSVSCEYSDGSPAGDKSVNCQVTYNGSGTK